MVKSNIETFLRIKPSNNCITLMHSKTLSHSELSNLIDNKRDSTEINYETRCNNSVIEIKIPDEMRKGYVNNLKRTYDFKFDGIFDKSSSQEDIFKNIGKKIIENSLEGYNNTVFCYGQTGSGKTFTMCGSKLWRERGLIPRILIDLFKQVKKAKNYSYEIFISYLEIYNENAYDLLDRHHSETDIENWRKVIVYEDNNGNIILKNLTMIKVENEQQALDLLMTGNYIRHVSSTPNNLASSRSHAVFSCVLEGRELNSDVMKVSKINLVDLAGSERMKSSQYDSNLANETKYINLSLSFLEQVIIALNEKANGQRTHIPYRNSLMTTILKDSLGGNCKTILIANVSSDIENLEETFSTMRFAIRCGKVENEIRVNEQMDLNILVSKLHFENEELRNKISKGNMGKFDNPKNFLEILDKELNPEEKDECKLVISEYLNNSSKNKKIEAGNANQLFFIVDYLLEFINNKERVYKDKMGNLIQENKELIKLIEENKNKMEQLENLFNNDKKSLDKINSLNMNFDYLNALKGGNGKYKKSNLEIKENIYLKDKEKESTEMLINNNTGENKSENLSIGEILGEKDNPVVYIKSFLKNKKFEK